MKQTTTKTNVNRLVKLARSTSNFDSPVKRRSISFGPETSRLVLIDEQADVYDAVIADVLAETEWADKFSERYVSERVNGLLLQLLINPERQAAKELFSRLTAEFDTFDEQQVSVVPIRGCNCSSGRVVFGDSDLVSIGMEERENLVAALQMRGVVGDRDAETREIVHRSSGDPGVVVVLRAIAEPMRAKERALSHAEHLLDLLRWATPLIYGYAFKSGLALGQTTLKTGYSVVSLRPEAEEWSMSREPSGSVLAFSLDPHSLEKLRELGAFDVVNILDGAERTNYEAAIVRALRWLGNSHEQTRPENELISLITCLEALFTPEGRDPIAQGVAEGTAFFLATGRMGRKEVRGFVKQMYAARSKVSHGGVREVLRSDLDRLRFYASLVIKVAISRRREFQTQRDVSAWLEDERLGCADPRLSPAVEGS